ncbi:MFS transporter [Sphingomonas sp. MMS24-J13]|uniref:MFS transporter n=1 Tax=Sphingomonas sp. MMS24-J13 TaxID=3238686 RepID=UPI00384D2E32
MAATVGDAVSATPAFFSVFGLLLVPIATDFGWPRAVVAGVMALVGPVLAVLGMVAGYSVDRFGVRRIVLCGNLSFGLMIVALAFTPASPAAFYTLFILCAVCSAFASPTLYGKAVAGWFDKQRGQALGFVAGVGNGVGSTLMPALGGLLLAYWGWRTALAGVGLTIAGIGFPVLFFLLRDPPRRVRPAQDDVPLEGVSLTQALRSPIIWVMLFSICVCAACMTATFTQVSPILTERGIPLRRVIPVISAFALVTAGWQWLFGALIDRVGRPAVMLPFYLLSVAGLLLLQQATTDIGLLCGGALMGLGLGTEYSGLTLLASRYFGVRHFGAIVGLMYAVINLLKGAITVGLNVWFDAVGSYGPALVVVEVVMVASALLLLLLPNFHKRGQPQPDGLPAPAL